MFRTLTPMRFAERYIGMREIPGEKHNPFIMAMLTLDNSWPGEDEVPWCSAFVNYVAWHFRLPRSKSLRARSWLEVGRKVPWGFSQFGDIAILKQHDDDPGPEVLDYRGHVGFVWHFPRESDTFELLGGNQSNSVSVQTYPKARLLGTRSITYVYPEEEKE